MDAYQPRVAVQLYGFRDYLKTPEDILKTLKRIKRRGYDYAQISGVTNYLDATEVRKICDTAGITPIGAHVSLQLFRENPEKVIEDCKKFDIHYAAIPWLSATDQKTLADWKRLFREFETLAAAFAKEGIVVQYHNHDFEFMKYGIRRGRGGETILKMLYDSTEKLQAELDLAWIARGGYNPIRWIEYVAGRMDQVHFKDWGIYDYRPEFRPVGEGSLDWPEIIKACKKARVRDVIVEQDTWISTGDPFTEYAISRKNLLALGI